MHWLTEKRMLSFIKRFIRKSIHQVGYAAWRTVRNTHSDRSHVTGLLRGLPSLLDRQDLMSRTSETTRDAPEVVSD